MGDGAATCSESRFNDFLFFFDMSLSHKTRQNTIPSSVTGSRLKRDRIDTALLKSRFDSVNKKPFKIQL